jgi:MFS superfamily sulfate permease-like transporter
MRAPALLPSLRGFRRSWLRADLVAGVAAGCVVIPQAMAYATIADMPVEVGLYTCMVPMVVYAVLGGSHVMSVSTTSTVALLCATTLAAAGLGTGTVNAIADLTTLVLLVAVVLLVFRVLHLGTLVDNISVSVLTGVKAGVGLTVAADQLPKLLGIAPDPDAGGFFETLGSVLSHLGDANGATVVLSAVTIAGLLLMRRLAPRVPAPLVAVAGASWPWPCSASTATGWR